MFGKKPAPPKAPWAVRLLTPDFVVDGYLDFEEHPESWPFFTPQAAATTTATLWLDAPRFTPTSATAGAPPEVSQWLVPFDNSHVAVLPLDEASLAAMRKNASSYRFPIAAVVHLGPYVVHGQLLSCYEDVADLSTLTHNRCLAMQDATIERRRPGAPFAGLQAPLVMLNGHWLAGIGLIK